MDISKIALTADEIKASCERCHLTTLLCAQDFDHTLADVREENPDMDEVDLHVATLVRMLDENLDFGCLTETEEEVDQDNHSDLMAARADIAETVASRWVAGRYSGHATASEIQLANNDARNLADEKLVDMLTPEIPDAIYSVLSDKFKELKDFVVSNGWSLAFDEDNDTLFIGPKGLAWNHPGKAGRVPVTSEELTGMSSRYPLLTGNITFVHPSDSSESLAENGLTKKK